MQYDALIQDVQSALIADQYSSGYPLTASIIKTPTDLMIAIVDDQAVWFLAFLDQKCLQRIKQFKKSRLCTITLGSNRIMETLERDLRYYHASKVHSFKAPIKPAGTPFQQTVWKALQDIPYGVSHSYRDIATTLGKPTAFRAVAQAAGANPISIIIPCHRMINADGRLGGYAGGVERKKWLLNHEKKNLQK